MSTFFRIDNDNILHPLGVRVTRDSRKEILPSIRENTEEIPGMDGEIDFGSELKARIFELHCVTDEGLSPIEKKAKQREIARYLNPLNGVRTLSYDDEPNMIYYVKCSGGIPPEEYATWFKFVIPFKMSDPHIYEETAKIQVGSGVIENEGTKETGLIIEMKGPLENPQISVGGKMLVYNGEIPAGFTLVVDTEKRTARLGSNNALDRYNKVFPMLPPGTTPVSGSSNITFKWKEKWV